MNVLGFLKLGRKEKENEVTVRPMPKVIFFWPLWLVSLICLFFPDASVTGQVWLATFALNLLVIAVDFSEERSLIAVLAVVVAILALLWFEVLNPVVLSMNAVQPVMNQTFYVCMFALFTIVYAFVWLYTRIDYWVFRPTEVVHRTGFFPKYRRYSTEQMRWQKEIPDVLERLLAGSGRLVMTTSLEVQPIIIEHVLFINDKDERISRLLGVRRVMTEPSPTENS